MTIVIAIVEDHKYRHRMPPGMVTAGLFVVTALTDERTAPQVMVLISLEERPFLACSRVKLGSAKSEELIFWQFWRISGPKHLGLPNSKRVFCEKE